MTKEQILQLLTDYCRTMLYGGKTLNEVESFLHVLRNYLQHGEFMRILRNLKQLEASLAYTPTQPSLSSLKAPNRFMFMGFMLFVYLGIYFFLQIFTVIPLNWGITVGIIVVPSVLQIGGKAYATYVIQRHTAEEMRRIWHTWEWQSLFMSAWLIFNVWNPIFLDMLGHTIYYFILSCLCLSHTPIWINWFWRGRVPEETIFISTPTGFLRRTSRLNHQQNIPDPEKVVMDFIEFFEEEARRRRENRISSV